MISIIANKAALTVENLEPLTAGMANSVQCQFLLTEHWQGLDPVAVFTDGDKNIIMLLNDQGICTLPHEVLETEGKTLQVGLYGTDGSGAALPTVWGSLGMVRPGAQLTEQEGKEPTPAAIAQILAVANQARAAAQSLVEDAQAGKFDGPQGERGVGLPTGGLTGQVLMKQSDGDYDFAWGSTVSVTASGTALIIE